MRSVGFSSEASEIKNLKQEIEDVKENIQGYLKDTQNELQKYNIGAKINFFSSWGSFKNFILLFTSYAVSETVMKDKSFGEFISSTVRSGFDIIRDMNKRVLEYADSIVEVSKEKLPESAADFIEGLIKILKDFHLSLPTRLVDAISREETLIKGYSLLFLGIPIFIILSMIFDNEFRVDFINYMKSYVDDVFEVLRKIKNAFVDIFTNPTENKLKLIIKFLISPITAIVDLLEKRLYEIVSFAVFVILIIVVSVFYIALRK